MGKKDQPRTKGNVKAASSTRAGDAYVATGFIGFSAVSENPVVAAAVVSVEEREQALEPELRQLFRRLHKKDCITRVKALEDLSAYVRSESERVHAAVVEAIPVWSHYFNRLATENEWKTRIALHSAHGAIAAKTRKQMGKHLREMMGAWVLGMNDPSSGVSQVAITAFQEVFPEAKRTDAILFGKKEVFEFMSHILKLDDSGSSSHKLLMTAGAEGKKKTPKNASAVEGTTVDRKASSDNPMGNEPWLSSAALGSLRFLVEKIPEPSTGLAEELHKLLASKQFQKLGRAHSTTTAYPWLQLLTVLCSKCPSLVSNYVESLSPVLMASLEPSSSFDLTGSRVTWEAILAYFIAVPSFWHKCSPAKTFFPRVAAFLRKGGRGHAATVYPSLLPLVSLFPEFEEERMRSFFNCLYDGLLSQGCLASVTETEAVLQTIFEITRFLIKCRQEKKVASSQLKHFVLVEKLATLVRVTWHPEELSPPLTLQGAFVQQETAKLLLSIKNEEVTEAFWESIGSDLLESIQRFDLAAKDKVMFVARFLSFLSKESPSPIPLELVQSLRETAERHFLERKSLLSLPLLLNLTAFPKNQTNVDSEALAKRLLDAMINTRLSSFVGMSANDLLTLLFRLIEDLCDDVRKAELRETVVNQLPAQPYLKIILQDESTAQQARSESTLAKLHDMAKNFTHDSSSETLDVMRAAFGGQPMSLPRSSLNSVVKEMLEILPEAKEEAEEDDLKSFSIFCDILQCINQNELLLCNVIDSLLIYMVTLSCRRLQSATEEASNESSESVLRKIRNTWKSLLQKKLLESGGTSLNGKLIAEFRQVLSHHLFNDNVDISDFLVAQETFFVFLEAFEEGSLVPETHVQEEKSNDEKPHMEFYRDFMKTHYVQDFSQLSWSPFVFLALRKKGVLSMIPHQPTSDEEEPTSLELQLIKCGSVVAESLLKKHWKDVEDFTQVEEGVVHLILSRCLLSAVKGAVSWLRPIESRMKQAMDVLQSEFPSSLRRAALSRISQEAHRLGGLLTLASFERESLRVSVPEILLQEEARASRIKGPCSDHAQAMCMTVLDLDVCREIVSSTTSPNPPSIPASELMAIWASAIERLDPASEVDSTLMVSVVEELRVLKKKFDESPVKGNPSEWPGESFDFLSALVHCSTVVIRRNPFPLSSGQWDFILCTASDLMEHIKGIVETNKTNIHGFHPRDVIFSLILSELIAELSSLMKSIFDGYQTGSDFKASNLLQEWDEFFVEHISEMMYSIFMGAVRLVRETERTVKRVLKPPLCTEMVLRISEAFSVLHPPRCASKELNQRMASLTEALSTVQCPSIKLSAYCGVCRLLPMQCKEDQVEAKKKRDCDEIDASESSMLEPPSWLIKPLIMSQEVVEAFLHEFQEPGETVIIAPQTESYSFVFTYLLLWDIYLLYLKDMDEEVVHMFMDYLREKGYLGILLNKIMFLTHVEDFTESLKPWDFEALVSPVGIQLFSWRVLIRAFEVTPVMVRAWFSNLNKRWGKYVDDLTTTYITPLLSNKELSLVQYQESEKKGNISIRARPTVKEVIANYKVEDSEMELVIKLPRNYPLSAPKVDAGTRVGVSSAQWQQWVLQLSAFLSQQNCRIVQGIKLFKRNLDQRFEGVEECYICYSVLHGSTRAMPKMACRTCHKKFHSACLYRWFSTSVEATCPLCRNVF